MHKMRIRSRQTCCCLPLQQRTRQQKKQTRSAAELFLTNKQQMDQIGVKIILYVQSMCRLHSYFSVEVTLKKEEYFSHGQSCAIRVWLNEMSM